MMKGMHINTTYFERLNAFKLKKDNMINQLIKYFSGSSEVIQIGVGGYSSSGKTVLIDAIFSIFDKTGVPGYIPDSFTGVLLDASDDIPAYSSHNNLRAEVGNNFHTDHATRDEGFWWENTYHAKLSFCDKEKVLLIRNLPGEMFGIFYAESGNERKSLKTRFVNFISQHREYKRVYKKLFRFEFAKDDPEQYRKIEEMLLRIRDEFINTLTQQRLVTNDQIPEIENNFFAFLFYLTSDYKVYCIKSRGLEQEEIATANENIYNVASSTAESDRFIICFTQFDRIFTLRELPRLNLLTDGDGITQRKGLWAAFLRNIGYTREHKVPVAETNIARYWLSMNILYKDLDAADQHVVNTADWKALKAITGRIRYNWFSTSVAYNYEAGRFFEFQNQEGNVSEDIWTWRNNGLRTPVGVLELILYILTKSGFNKNKWNLALPREIAFGEVIKKIKGRK